MKITYKAPMHSPDEKEILPPGWYDFDVVQVYATSKEGSPLVANNGIPYMKLVCAERNSGITLLHFLFLSPDDAPKISALVYACQLSAEEGQQMLIDADTFHLATFRGRVDTNTGFDGVFRNRIIKVRRRQDRDCRDGAPLVVPLEVSPRDNDTEATQFVDDQQTNAQDPDQDDDLPF